MIPAITRFVMVAGGLLSGYLISRTVDWQTEIGLAPSYVIILFVSLGAAIGYVFGGILGRELGSLWRRAEARVADLASADMILGVAGLVTGLVIALLATQPLRLLRPISLAVTLSVIAYVVCAYVGVSVGLTRRREFLAMFPRFAPGEKHAEGTRMIALDTSAIIDGRFTELARLGLLPGDVRLPRFVLAELQTLADSADDTRRSRGRRGLDLLATLPAEEAVSLLEIDYPELSGVDDKLVRLASDTGALLVTVDYNLSKVAAVRGISVLNLNDAAAALRPTHLPGDTLLIKVLKPGKEANQGVGYLEDGTMVVIANGRHLVGDLAQVEVTSVLQTPAGRMIFAGLTDSGLETDPVAGTLA